MNTTYTDLQTAAAAVSPMMRHMLSSKPLPDALAAHMLSDDFEAWNRRWWPQNARACVGHVYNERDCSEAVARRAVLTAAAVLHMSGGDLDEWSVALEALLILAYIAGARGVKVVDL